MRRDMRSVPDRLTLVDASNPNALRTLVVEEDLQGLVVTTTGDGPVHLDEAQAKKLRGRINKFFRDNR